jgi:enamine deaminase RidA (YjgF/YER057c/UK114 family)
MDIERFRGKAVGRNKAVRHAGIVYAVGTAEEAGPDIRAQTRVLLEKISQTLVEAGSDRSRLLRVQIFLDNMADKPAMDEVWNEWIGRDWRLWPQRACVGAPLVEGALIEIVATAAVKDGDAN